MTREEFIKIMCEYLDVPTDDDVRFIGDIYDKMQQDFIDTDNFVMKFKKDKDNGRKDKELLLKDLCARLPYGVKIQYDIYGIQDLTINELNAYIKGAKNIKPYLRPLSSMTEEEWEEYEKTLEIEYQDMLPEPIYHKTLDSYYYLLEHHFDFRGLIPAGCAIEVTEENNPYKD